jgi:hypothetical protein
MRNFTLSAAIVAVGAFTGSAAFADPTYSLTLQDVGTGTSITESGTSQVTYSGTLGNFTIEDLSIADLNPVNTYDVGFDSQDIFKAGGSDTLNVFVTVSNLTAPVPSSLWIGTTTSANFEASSVQGWLSSTYFDPNNDTGIAGLVDLLSTSSGGVTANQFFSTTSGATELTSGPFSYTVEFSLDLLTNEFADGAGATTDVLVPEPASTAVFAAGLLGMAMVRRKRA